MYQTFFSSTRSDHCRFGTFGSFSLSLKNHKVPCTIPLAQLPLHLSNTRPNPPEFLKLEATLAVQERRRFPTFFPSTSSVPRRC
jgi:hypothetical protein